MTTEIFNGIITKVRLCFEEHGILTSYIEFDGGRSNTCSFGGFNLAYSGSNVCSRWVAKCMTVAGVSEWESLVGKPVRLKRVDGRIEAIGHIVRDVWFEPGIDLDPELARYLDPELAR